MKRVPLAALIIVAGAHGADAADPWVHGGRTLDASASILLSRAFTTKSGTFRALPESVLDDTKTISGDFLVGTYRFAYDAPITEQGHKLDELVSVELLDCRGRYFGTLKQTRTLRGNVVSEMVTKDADVLMMQTSTPSVDRQLCDVHDGKTPRPLKP